MSAKYDPLERYLVQRATTQQEVTLTFKEIDALLDNPLPQSAHRYREWWANQKDISTRPQAKAWLNAGFVVDAVQQEHRNGMVRFRRS
jgi:hypothetical protein